jgi:hypothetical protein
MAGRLTGPDGLNPCSSTGDSFKPDHSDRSSAGRRAARGTGECRWIGGNADDNHSPEKSCTVLPAPPSSLPSGGLPGRGLVTSTNTGLAMHDDEGRQIGMVTGPSPECAATTRLRRFWSFGRPYRLDPVARGFAISGHTFIPGQRRPPWIHRLLVTLECRMTMPVASKAIAIMRLRSSAAIRWASSAPNRAVTACAGAIETHTATSNCRGHD